MDATLRIIDNICEDVTQASLKQVLENGSCTFIMELFGVHIKFIRGGHCNLSTFWLTYMDMTEIRWDSPDHPEREPRASHMTRLTMHAISNTTTPRCINCPQPTQMCTLNSCTEVSQFSLAPTTPSEESKSIKRSKKRRTRTRIC